GWHPVGARPTVEPHAGRGHLAEGGGRQPDRVVQGPRDDDGGERRGGRGGEGRGVCLHRQHLGLGSRLCGAGRDDPGGAAAGRPAACKLAQAAVHGARIIQSDGYFDECLELAQKLAVEYPVSLVNSVNPARIAGQRSAAFEIVDDLGDAPQIHAIPVGNAGNITAYRAGYSEYAADGLATVRPRMWGFQAAGSAPLVTGHPITEPRTVASAIRIGNPASGAQALAAARESEGMIGAVTDDEILAAQRMLAAE